MSIIHIPDFSRLKAARDVLAHRAKCSGATPAQRTRANATLLAEMQQGTSTAMALSVASKKINPRHSLPVNGGGAA